MSTTIEAQAAPARNPGQASTKHHVVDHRFTLLLEEDFRIPAATVLDALQGEPKKAAIAVCGWASRTDDPAYALRCWARRHGREAYRAPSVARGRGRSNTRGGGDIGGGPARRGGCGGIDPARVRANLEKMGG